MLSRILSGQAIFVRCNVADEVNVRILLAELAPRAKPREHEGEAEAVIQAAPIGVPAVIMDDRRARKWAERNGLRCHGTLWVLRTLRTLDLIPAIRPKIAILQRHGIWLPKLDVAELLREFGEDARGK
jgi:predicted nucleic acid-binding protein